MTRESVPLQYSICGPVACEDFAKLSSVTKRRLADVTAFHRQDRSGEDRLPGHLDFENDGKRKRD